MPKFRFATELNDKKDTPEKQTSNRSVFKFATDLNPGYVPAVSTSPIGPLSPGPRLSKEKTLSVKPLRDAPEFLKAPSTTTPEPNPVIGENLFQRNALPIRQNDNPFIKGLKGVANVGASIAEAPLEAVRKFSLQGGSILTGGGIRKDLPKNTSFIGDILPKGASNALASFQESHPIAGTVANMAIETAADPLAYLGSKAITNLLTPKNELNMLKPYPVGSNETLSALKDLPEPQSKIIIGKSKEPFSFKNAWNKFYTGVVDKQKSIMSLEKPTGTDIGKLASNTRNVSGIVDYNILKGLVNKEGNAVGKSLKETVEAIPKGKEEDFWTYMSQRHNIDRAREGKPVQANYTPEMSAQAVKQVEKANPGYKEIGDDITKWLDDFMKTWGVDTGIVNKELYQELRQTYKSYFPTQRDYSTLEKAIPDNVSQKFVDQRSPIRKATGSERDIIDPVENIMNLVNRTVRAAKFNEVGQSLLDSVRKDPEKMSQFAEILTDSKTIVPRITNKGDNQLRVGTLVKASDRSNYGKIISANKEKGTFNVFFKSKDGTTATIPFNENELTPISKVGKKITSEGKAINSNLDNVVTVLENGKPVYLKINDKPLLDAMNGLPKAIGRIPVLDTITSGFKGLITHKNPLFAIRNITRDIPTAYTYGSEANPLKFGAGLIGAGKDILTQSPRFQRYQAVGGGGANFFKSGDATKAAAELTNLGKRGTLINKLSNKVGNNLGGKIVTGTANVVLHPLKAIETFNNLTETAPRLAEFNRILDKTGDVTKALHAANDVTVNFSRSGNITKAADKVVPYLNAGVQGLDKFFRGFKDPKTAIATLTKAGVGITTPSIALYMINKDDPNYQALDNRTKDTYYLIPKGDGTFIKLPKSRELGVLFGALFERAARQAEGQKDAFKGFGKSVATSFAPANPVESNFFSPATRNLATNKDFAGRAIVPQGMLMDKRSPYLQYDEKTTSVAKAIGELSTKVIPGGLSPKQIDYLMKSYSGVLGQVGIPLATPGGSPLKAIKTQFTSDPVFSNQITGDFYDKLNKLSATAVDKNIIEKIPSKKLTTEEDVKNSMQGISSAISRGTKQINKIQAGSSPNKDDQIRAVRKQILELMAGANAANDPRAMQLVEDRANRIFKK